MPRRSRGSPLARASPNRSGVFAPCASLLAAIVAWLRPLVLPGIILVRHFARNCRNRNAYGPFWKCRMRLLDAPSTAYHLHSRHRPPHAVGRKNAARSETRSQNCAPRWNVVRIRIDVDSRRNAFLPCDRNQSRQQLLVNALSPIAFVRVAAENPPRVECADPSRQVARTGNSGVTDPPVRYPLSASHQQESCVLRLQIPLETLGARQIVVKRRSDSASTGEPPAIVIRAFRALRLGASFTQRGTLVHQCPGN
jgi:hypothetical protein